jgi:hypothetical protein
MGILRLANDWLRIIRTSLPAVSCACLKQASDEISGQLWLNALSFLSDKKDIWPPFFISCWRWW